MRRFEVWELSTKDARGNKRLVIILQSEKIDHLPTIVVAPLVAQRPDMVVPKLTPSLMIDGVDHTIMMPLMAAIERKQLTTYVADAREIEYEITCAFDRVFSGN
jgi:hypothetical protein